MGRWAGEWRVGWIQFVALPLDGAVNPAVKLLTLTFLNFFSTFRNLLKNMFFSHSERRGERTEKPKTE